MKFSLTPKQAELLAYIKAYMTENAGTAPSYEEMISGTSLNSKSVVHHVLRGLQERGHIAQMKNRARAIVVLGDDA